MLILKMIYLELCLEWRIHENLWKYNIRISKKTNQEVWVHLGYLCQFKKEGENGKGVIKWGPLEVNTKMKPLIYQNVWKMNPPE